MAPHITLCQCFPNFCFMEQPPKQFSSLEEPLPFKIYTVMKTKRQVFAHRDCSTISNCQTKIPTLFLGTLGNFCSIEKLLYIYSMILSGTPYDDLPNHGWETLLYTQINPCCGRQASNHCYSHLPWIHPF